MIQDAGVTRYAGRSTLAAVGIAISVATMIVLASLVHSVKSMAASGLASLGSHVLMIGPSPQAAMSLRNTHPLGAADVQNIRTRVSEADLVAPIAGVQGLLRANGRRQVATIMGVMPGMEGLSGFEARRGRFIVDRDVSAASRVVVLSEAIEAALGSPALNDFVLVSGRPFRFVGVVAASSSLLGSNRQDSVFIPATTAETLYTAALARAGIVVRVREGHSLEAAANAVRFALRASRNLTADEPDDFSIQSQTDLLASIDRLETIAQAILMSLIGIALVIAAIGVLNSVLTSVLERTAEIGLRRAVGATRISIQMQFLLESLLVASAGSAAGVALGIGVSLVLERWLGVPTAVDWRVAAIATLAALLFSALAALWPAVRAGRLDPVTALQRE
jgi:putative ABC transport system permease protein